MDALDNTLTPKQQLFIEHYLSDARFNGTLAAQLAGYAGGNDTLRVCASRLLANANIASQVRAYVEQAGVTRERVLLELADVAFAEWSNFTQQTTNHRGEVIEAKLVLTDKIRALELLGKSLRMFADRVEITQESTVRVALSWADEPQRITAHVNAQLPQQVDE